MRGARAATAASSEIVETSVVVGHGWALVRESRSMDMVEGEQEVVLDRIPPEADLSSLTLRSRRVPLQLMEWSREGQTNASPRAISVVGDQAIWRPADERAERAQEPGGRRVRGRVYSPLTWKNIRLELSYIVRGPTWDARYQAMVRGEQAEEKEPVSVDFAGSVTISNPTSASWQDASIQVVGEPGPDVWVPQNDPGILMVDEDSPLADLWRRHAPESAVPHAYALPGRVSVSPQSSTSVLLVRTTRTPASRLYVMGAEDVPFGTASDGYPLRKFIVIRNSAANRMGIALPPGRVGIYVGASRNRYLQEAWQARADVNDEIRIDLGAAEDVTGLRRSLGRGAAIGGYYEESFGLKVMNRRDSSVLVEILEKPPLILEWAVVRTSLPNRGTGRSLEFLVEARPGREVQVEYQLRVRQPDL